MKSQAATGICEVSSRAPNGVRAWVHSGIEPATQARDTSATRAHGPARPARRRSRRHPVSASPRSRARNGAATSARKPMKRWLESPIARKKAASDSSAQSIQRFRKARTSASSGHATTNSGSPLRRL